MANLIAGKRVVPELIQHDFTAANIVQQLQPLLPDGVARESMMKGLGTIRDALRVRPAVDPARNIEGTVGAIERVAAITLEELEACFPGSSRTGCAILNGIDLGPENGRRNKGGSARTEMRG